VRSDFVNLFQAAEDWHAQRKARKILDMDGLPTSSSHEEEDDVSS
jgi:hypothetical protein